MTLEEEYKLSCYQELTEIDDKKCVYLVKSVEDNCLYVKKIISIYNYEVYRELMQINTPGTPKVYMCVKKDEKLIIIEEYIHGKTIYEGCGNYTETEAVNIITKVAEILKNLHSNNPVLIHRDVKPKNIMISNDGKVKLIDFNAAKIWNEYEMQDTILVGTMDYAAPEQFGFGQSDARTDIYGLGVTLNVMITGCLPKEKMASGYIGRVIKKCTELDPNNRYQSVEELIVVLKSLTSDNKKLREYNKWRPVGFRSLKAWKILIAIPTYIILFLLCFTSEFKDLNGELMNNFGQFMYRGFVTINSFGFIILLFDYGDIIEKITRRNVNNIFLKLLIKLVCYAILLVVTFILLLIYAVSTA